MTAAVEPLYVRDGSRFVLYSPGAQHTPPIPTPRPVTEAGEEVWDENGHRPDPEHPFRTIVRAEWCPHGHTLRWALRFTEKGAPNCPPCHRGR